MVVGVHADSPDQAAILMLAPLGVGQSITITDDTWTGSGFSGSSVGWSDSHEIITANSDWPVGHVVVKSMDLSSGSGDDVLVYQGPKESPTFICGLEYYNGAFSHVPPGLTVGENAIQLSHRDNWVYDGTKSGARARSPHLRCAIQRPSRL